MKITRTVFESGIEYFVHVTNGIRIKNVIFFSGAIDFYERQRSDNIIVSYFPQNRKYIGHTRGGTWVRR